MGFALKQEGVPKEERRGRVRETRESSPSAVHSIDKPRHLSGGQRQAWRGASDRQATAVISWTSRFSNLDAKDARADATEVVELQAAGRTTSTSPTTGRGR